MKSMILNENGPIKGSPLVLSDVPVPEPAAGEIRVKVKACGICRTDLHVIEGELPLARSPITPGHQIVGIVDSLGEEAERFEIGDRVGIAWLRHTCGECKYCIEGKENLCENSRYTGYHEDGGFAEYALVPEAFAYSIPEVFGDSEATPLLCAGIIGYRALKRSEIKPRGRLGIFGFGSSAHITAQVARNWGCELYVSTRGKSHQELARKLGAEWVGGAEEEMPVRVESAIVFAPVGELVLTALRSLEKGGTLALAGIYMTDIPRMNYTDHLFYEKNLRTVTANTRQDGEELLLEAAKIPIRPRIQEFPLEEANRALYLLKQDRISGSGVLVVSG
ncbi:MAG: zinc-dependent alcohol dehydrogenase family protein [Candidatus Glassbacteria bacterium]